MHEIALLADQRSRAGHAFTRGALEEWHGYILPAFTERMKSRLWNQREVRFPRNRGGLLLGRGRLVGGQVLVGDRAQHLRAAVPSAVVVELIASGQHDAAGVVGVGQLVARQNFPFQAGEERLGGGIVETRSDPAHGLTNA